MLSFNIALENLALALPRAGYIDQACDTIALVYRSEIEVLPIARTTLRKFISTPISDQDLGKLVRLMVRDMQRWASAIIDECGLHADDVAFDGLSTFKPEHAKLIQQAWDSQPTAPGWRAFDCAAHQMWPRAMARNVPCDACEKNASGVQAGKCLHDNPTACITAIAAKKVGL